MGLAILWINEKNYLHSQCWYALKTRCFKSNYNSYSENNVAIHEWLTHIGHFLNWSIISGLHLKYSVNFAIR